ncbi:MAG: hypothetical protein ABIU05_26895 [Nitrospirales bacterium]
MFLSKSSLGFPVYQEHWEEWAVAQGLSGRHLRFVLCDESPTSHVGYWRFQPEKIHHGGQQGRWLLTAGHSGFVIGLVYAVTLATKDTMPGLGQDGMNRPEWVE